MLRDNTVDEIYKVENEEGEKELFVSAGFDSLEKEYVVKIINIGNEEKHVDLKVGKISKPLNAKVTMLRADAHQRVTPDTPNAVSILEGQQVIDEKSAIAIPSNSFSVYRIKK